MMSNAPSQPTGPMSSLRSAHLAALALSLGTILLLFRAWQPLDSIIGTTADDMFYYLEIARNLAEGRGPTFDGETMTNGWHPLWMGMLVLLRWIAGSSTELQVHLALSILAIASAATGAALWRVGGRLGGPLAGLAALSFWILQPWTAQITLSGVEAPLATAALAWCLVLQPKGRSGKGAVLLGLCMGLACLARTDSVIICSLLFLCTYAPRLQGPKDQKAEVPWGGASRCLAGGSLLLLPWLLWNLAVFGRISQDSARAISSLRHSRYFSSHGFSEFLGSMPSRFLRWMDALGDLVWLPGWALLVWMCILLAVSFSAAKHRHPAATALFTGAAGVLLVAAFYSFYFWYRQHWYMLSSLMLLSLLAGLLASLVFESMQGALARLPELAKGGAILLAAAGISLPASADLHREGTWPWQRVYLQIAGQLPGLPEGSRVGAFNAGIYGHFSGLGVVNLDGVVNGDVLDAMQRKELLSYMRSLGITHLVDHEHAYSWFMEYAEPGWATAFTVVGRFPNSSSGGAILLTEIGPPAVLP
jgi:hypothetical protein